MNIVKSYISYLKNNPEGYWFKRRWYGYGWVPARWQGWVVLTIYILAIAFFSFTLDESLPDNEVIASFVLPVIFLTLILLYICYKKAKSLVGNGDRRRI